MAKRRSRYVVNAVDPDPIIRLWLLRILVPLGGHREFVRTHGFNNDTLAEVLGLGHWVDPTQFDIPDFLRRSSKASHADAEKNEFDLKAVQSELRVLHQKAEKQWGSASLTSSRCVLLRDSNEKPAFWRVFHCYAERFFFGGRRRGEFAAPTGPGSARTTLSR